MTQNFIYIYICIYIYILLTVYGERTPDFVICCYPVLLSSIVIWIFFEMKLLQTPLKLPYFEKYCPLNKKGLAEGL